MSKKTKSTVPEAKQKDFRVQIRQVRLVAFRVDESLFVPEPNKEVLIDIQNKIRFNISSNLLIFSLRGFYYYKGSSKDNVLVDIEVENLFFIDNLETYIENVSEVLLPGEIWTTIVGLGISHTRALLCERTATTMYRNIIIPIMDPAAVAKSMFPNKNEQKAEHV